MIFQEWHRPGRLCIGVVAAHPWQRCGPDTPLCAKVNMSKPTNRSSKQAKGRRGSLPSMLLWTACAARTALIRMPCANVRGLKHTKRRSRALLLMYRTKSRYEAGYQSASSNVYANSIPQPIALLFACKFQGVSRTPCVVVFTNAVRKFAETEASSRIRITNSLTSDVGKGGRYC